MADRYVFSVHGHTKYGTDLGVRFFSVWCASEGDALALYSQINAHMPNYSQLSVSKVIREAMDCEIPDEGATLTDVAVTSWLFGSTTDPNVRRTVKLPLAYVQDGDVSTVVGKSDVQAALMELSVSPTGAPLDIVISTTDSGKNIVSGGPIS